MVNKNLDMIADWLLVIGGLNWGLTIFNMNLVTMLLPSTMANIVYGLVGIAAIVKLPSLFK